MAEVIACPGCGAPLNLVREQPTTRCPYCRHTIDVSEVAGQQPPQPPNLVIQVSSRSPERARGLTCLIVTIVGVISLTGLVIALVAGGIGLGTAVAVLPAATALSALQADLPQATTIPSFGGEGIGPGRFTDARSIGVDGEGRIYVGEYQGGRVQVFDAEGGFLTQWHADRDRPLRGLAVGRDGTVFLVQGGTIQRFQGETGEVLQPVDHPAGDGFDDVAMTADGGLVAFWYAAGQDNLVTFGRSRQVELTIPAAASGPSGESELDLRVAADGEGNLYGLGTFTQSVFVYSPEGRFLNRVGSSGDETGQLRAPSSIAVDDQGRIYVGDIDGVEVFHRDGRHLGTIDVQGTPFGLTFDAQGLLLVVNGTRVAWYPPLE
ncbi:MAG: NHL repeat-containing protein [Anaerolineales bacterium]|nr:NHL repeat-containing protein [Anaerolineales bacterium]